MAAVPPIEALAAQIDPPGGSVDILPAHRRGFDPGDQFVEIGVGHLELHADDHRADQAEAEPRPLARHDIDEKDIRQELRDLRRLDVGARRQPAALPLALPIGEEVAQRRVLRSPQRLVQASIDRERRRLHFAPKSPAHPRPRGLAIASIRRAGKPSAPALAEPARHPLCLSHL